jgi:hypothetical protein
MGNNYKKTAVIKGSLNCWAEVFDADEVLKQLLEIFPVNLALLTVQKDQTLLILLEPKMSGASL